MKYPYARISLTVPDCSPRTRIPDAKLRLKEWASLQEYRESDMVSKHTVHHRSIGARHIILILLLSLGLCFKTTTLLAQEAIVTSLMSKDLKDFPGKEGLMITVEYPPGASDLYIVTMHTHLYTCWKAPSSCS